MRHFDEFSDIEGINLVVFDVDGVIVPRGSKVIEQGNMVTYNLKMPSEKFIGLVRDLLEHTNVAVSSGRSMLTLKTMFTELIGEEINGNVFLMMAENGGRLSWGVDEMGAGHDPAIMRQLSLLRKELRKIKHENLKGFEPKESILTIHCEDRVPEIEEKLKDYSHYIIWNGEAYDIGENGISKGSGLARMKKRLREVIGGEFKTIAIGDRENDIDLLKEADISVSADRTRLSDADYYIDHNDELPGVIFAERLLELFREQ